MREEMQYPPSGQNWPQQEQPAQPPPPNTQWGQQPYPPEYARPEYYIQPGTYYRRPATVPPQGHWQQPPPSIQQKEIKRTSTYIWVSIISFILVVFGGVGIRFLYPLNTILPIPSGTWTTTHTFTGTGRNETGIFSISSDWKLLYTCTYQQISGTSTTVDGYLGVSVYSPDNTILDVAVNTRCKETQTTGETEEHIGGNIYLDINATGDWKIQIQELK
jgi:hypothetical protein